MRPKTLAVSSVDSFLPSWMSFAPRYSGWAPRSIDATVKAARVRVDVFQTREQYFTFQITVWNIAFFKSFK